MSDLLKKYILLCAIIINGDGIEYRNAFDELDLKLAPAMNFGAQKEIGARIAVSIKKIKI